MASDVIADSGASALGGEMVAAKERMTPSGLRISDLVIGDGPEATSGQLVVVNYRGTFENGKEFDAYGRGSFSFPGCRSRDHADEGAAGMQVGGKRKRSSRSRLRRARCRRWISTPP